MLATAEDLAAFVLADPLCQRLRRVAEAHERPLALVGGFVRDFLLGREALDWDLVVPGDPTPLVADLTRAIGGPVVTLDADFGVVRTKLKSGLTIDFVKQQAPTLAGDLTRRDLTVNALAVELATGRLVDPSGGLADLQAGVIRTHDRQNLVDDPLRLLRVFRFAATLNYEIAPATMGYVRELAPAIAAMAGERVLAELAKLLASERAGTLLRAMHGVGLLAALFPELAPETLFHAGALGENVQRVLDELADPAAGQPGDRTLGLWEQALTGDRPRRALLQLGALLFGLAPLAGDRLLAIAERLHLGKRESAWLLAMHAAQPAVRALLDEAVSEPRRAQYRLFRDHGDAALAAAVGHYALVAPWHGAGARALDTRAVAFDQRFMELVAAYWAFEDARAPRLIGGHDLIRELKMPAGPAMTPLLAALDEAQALGEVTSREEALAWAARLLAGGE